ncbi:MAG: glucokinase [Sphingomonadaceae bacterium]|nr:glucokinase [Sphingomonadaceae bacterium]
MEIVALDIGGTHARFAIASLAGGGAVALGEPVTLRTDDFVSLKSAWAQFARRCAGKVPNAAAIAIAGPVAGETVQMTNNSWVIDTARLDEQLGVNRVTVLNDFAAVAHAVANAGEEDFIRLAGPDTPLPQTGTISVIGPGTGLGVAHFHRFGARYHVEATEGGHVDFAPVDAVDDAVLQHLRKRHRRVSVERVVSGPGIVAIHAALAALEDQPVPDLDDRLIWEKGLSGEDTACAAAVDHFCLSLGSVAGDYALAHGASGVVIAGGLGLRIQETLARSGFAARFTFKGRYEQMMAGIPVKLITHPQPGLLGAAAAFAAEHFGEFET